MPTARKTISAPKLPFPVPPPIDRALKTAAEKVEVVASETKVAAAKLEETVRSAATSVKERGQDLARDPKAFVRTVVRDGKTFGKKLTADVEKMRVDVSKEATRIADEVARRVSAAVEKVVERSLHKLNVPTHEEFRSLTRKVEHLGDKIDSLHTPPVRKAARVTRPRTRASR